jgi:O-antigen ligase
MIKAIYHRTTENIEYIITIILLAAIITFNKTFAYIGISSVYITEFIAVVCLLSFGTKLILNGSLKSIFDKESQKHLFLKFWPLLVIFLFAVVRLYIDLNYGVQAIRHSMIFMYSVIFMLLFILVIDGNKQFFFIAIYFIIVLSSLFNGTKIIIYKFLNYSFNYYEQERVYHIETDTICASISILGLLVYRKFFWNKSKTGFTLLLLLNLSILILTVKRSAVFAIVPSLVIYFFLIRKEINSRKLLNILGFTIIAGLLFLLVWYLLNNNSFNHKIAYITNKLSLHEKNTSWRIEAWKLAWQKFKESPWFGIGYGPKIIELPVDNVNTNDPHNSLLAFLVRHGIFIFSLYIFFIARTFKIIFNEIKSSKDDKQQNDAIFICLGLTAMMVFAFFNVVLENQYEGIFFYFFLSAIYVIKKKETNIQPSLNRKTKLISMISIMLFLGFVMYAFSPYNQIKRIPIYSMETNYSLPTKLNCEQGHLTYTSQKDMGIIIQKKSEDSTTSIPELLWFVPPQINKLQPKNYSLILECNQNLKDLYYSIEYDDQKRIPLKCILNNSTLTFKLDTLAWYKNNLPKPKFFIISFPNNQEYKNINIKNIFISRNK